MTFDASRDHRRSVRLAGFDYRAAGAYFITICASRRSEVFGRIENNAVTLNGYGRIVVEEWQRTAALRAEIALDEFIVMPDHFHAIVWIVGAHGNAPLASQPPRQRAHCHAPLREPRSLSSLVSGFKGAVTRRINAQRATRNWSPVQVWQRGYYERIVRDENELNETRRYIFENPSRPRDDAKN